VELSQALTIVALFRTSGAVLFGQTVSPKVLQTGVIDVGTSFGPERLWFVLGMLAVLLARDYG
jgi:phosphate/sulfate permease